MRKLFLLQRNSEVKKSKSTIAELQRLGSLRSTRYLMIPILSTNTSYMAVAGDFIETFDWEVACIRYHMQLFATQRGPENQTVETCIYDYSTVSLTIYTIEEFYNAIHNIFANHYIRELNTCLDGSERFYFIKISEIEITISKGKTVIDHYIVRDTDVDDVPFDVDQSYKIVGDLASKYGIKNASNYMHLPNIVFFRGEENKRYWEESKNPIILGLSVTHICVGSPFSSTYVILKAIDYDVALRMNTASIFIMPTYLSDYCGATIDNPHYDKLPITTHFGIPRYEFDNSDATLMAQATESLLPYIMEIYPITIHDPEDIMPAIEYLPLMMKTYHELIKVDMAEAIESDNLCGLELISTVMIDICIDIDDVSHPSDTVLHIYSDVFQDVAPKIEEVCYLLYLEEKSK